MHHRSIRGSFTGRQSSLALAAASLLFTAAACTGASRGPAATTSLDPTISPTPAPSATSSSAATATEEPVYWPDELAVKFAAWPNAEERSAFAASNGLVEMAIMEGIGWIAYRVADGTPFGEKVAALAELPVVVAVVPDHPAQFVELQGTMGGNRELAANCAWIRDDSSQAWELGGLPPPYAAGFDGKVPVLSQGDRVVARGGDVLLLRGFADPPDLGSFCMVGRILLVTEVVSITATP
jgi:hypothetical protein